MTMAAADIDGTMFAVGSAQFTDAGQAQQALQAMKTAMVRNIGGSLGVTITSVFFEQRRATLQLLAYDEYASGTAEHSAMMHTLQQTLHESGFVGGTADRMALGAIRREMDIEAIAAGFRDSFLLLALFFILGCIPLVSLLVSRQRGGKAPKHGA